MSPLFARARSERVREIERSTESEMGDLARGFKYTSAPDHGTSDYVLIWQIRRGGSLWVFVGLRVELNYLVYGVRARIKAGEG